MDCGIGLLLHQSELNSDNPGGFMCHVDANRKGICTNAKENSGNPKKISD